MKKLNLLFTALLLLCSVGTATAHDFEVGGIYYNITNDTNKIVEVTYRGTFYNDYSNEYTGSVVIPESVTYNGTTYSVTSIGNPAFSGCKGLTNVVIGNSVTSIGNSAFSGCSGLTSITIPNSVTNIGNDAFYGCSGLTSITIPNSVTSIGNSAFSGCSGLTSITIPNSVTSIGDEAFRSCTGLTSVVIGNSVTSIGWGAFNGCSGLTSVVIGNSVTSIGNYAFYNCYGLTSITIPNSVTSIGESAFYGCTGLTSITIPSSVTSIEREAFYGCTGLTSITIPNSVTSIGWGAFNGCSGLTSITIPNSVTNIGNDAFYGCTGLTSITIPNSVTSIGGYAFSGCTGLKTVINFSNLKFSKGSTNNGYIAYYATKVYNAPNGSIEGDFIFGKPNDVNSLLYYLGNATEITLPADYKGENYAIGADAFNGNSTITSIEIPNSVTSIGNYAFYGCSGLTSITIPNSVTSIGDDAFRSCTGLTSIEIPNSVTSIGEWAFYGCSGLTSVVIGNSVTSIGNSAFYGCSGLTSVVIGNSVTSIGNSAFSGCSGLKTVINFSNLKFSKGSSNNGYIAYYTDKVYNAPNGSIEDDFIFGKPNDVNTLVGYLGNATELTLPTDYKGGNYAIGANAFNGNTTITSVTIPNSVTSIGESAFEGCKGLTSVEFNAENCTSMGSYYYPAFENCTALSTVTIGENVKNIPDYAFYSCTGLTSITIPNSVTSIESNAFKGCTGLTSIVIPNSVTSIGYYAFENCSGLTSIVIPNSVTSIGDDAFRSCTGLTSIEIPNSVTSIGESAFYGCTGLKTIYNISNLTFSKGSTNNGYIAYYATKVYNAPNGSMEGDFIFGKPNDVNTLVGYLGNATELTLPADYKGENYAIGANSFENNKIITSVVIPNSATIIEEYAFSGCTSLKDIKIGDRVVSVERYAFSGCSSLENLRIGDGMKSIEEYAFYNCANLKEIVLGKRTNYIGNNAFASSDKIESIYALPTRAINCENATTAFHQNAYKYATLYVKESSIDSYDTTEPWSKFYIEPIGDFTLTYMVDGEVYKKEKYEYDSIITPLALPEKEGHTFSGWSDIPATMPAEDITVVGSFCVNSYNVTFVIDGEEYQTIPVNYGESIPLPEEPVKDGCTFSGWSEIPTTMPAEDITITGAFYANYYTVTYVVDGEIYATVTVGYNSVIPEIEEPVKEGHTFNEWENVPDVMPAKDITITGSFSVNSYNVTFVIDGEEYQTIPVNYGESIPLPEEPVKDGCTFSGWSEIPTTMPAEDITITGAFYANYYTVTYVVDGEIYATVTVGYNSVIPEIEEPVKEGHTFNGWENVPDVMPAKDITITASFSVNSYKAIFLVDNALYAILSVNYGEAIELPEPPQKEGFVFEGWNGLPEIMPAEDIVLIAIFTEETAIEDVKDENEKVKAIYDLQGRKVDTLNKGIYIIDGKKVLIK